MKMGLRVCACLVILSTIALSQGGPPGAAIRDLVVAGEDDSLVFVATNAGVFVSSTGGQSWTTHNEGLPSLDSRRIAGNDTVQFVAMREDGVYRSRDGRPWEFAGDGLQGNDILSIEMSYDNPDLIFAGSATGQVFLSNNGGEGWISASVGLLEGAYTEITASPVDPQLFFASNVSGEQLLGRLFRSTDAGATWEEVISGPASMSGVGLSESTPGLAWIATSLGLFRTTDSGATFTGPVFPTIGFLDATISPTDSDIVFAGTTDRGVLRTTDGGQNWELASQDLPRAAVNRVEVMDGLLLAGLGGSGVFRSYDQGSTWEISTDGIHGTEVLSVSVSPDDDDAVLASAAGGQIFRSQSGGTVWGQSRDGFSAFRAEALRHGPAGSNIVYLGTISPLDGNDGSFSRSTDGGRTWEIRAAGIPFFDVAVDPNNADNVYIGTQTDSFFGTPGLSRTSDGGLNFETVFGSRAELSFLDVLNVEFDPNNSQNIYLIVRDPFSFPVLYQFVFTNNGGSDWFGAGLTATPLTGIAVDPNNGQRIVIGSFAGAFVSQDGGATFAASNAGLPDGGGVVVGSTKFHPADGRVYISTSSGVFRSEDGGASWTPADNGLQPWTVREFGPDPNRAGVLYAATPGGGVFKTTDGGANWVPTGGIAGLTSAGIVNAATFSSGAIAPGEIVSIFVSNAGPENGIAATAFDPETGKLPTELGGVRVFFDDDLAAMFFARRDQLNVQAPFEISGKEAVKVRVEYNGVSSGNVMAAVRATDPGLFAPVLNQDFSLNSDQNRATRGSVVQLFATGQGNVTPTLMSGLPGPGVAPLPVPEAAVRVLVNGEEANILFAGLTPGLVGLMQINVQLPANLSGEVTIQLFVGDVESPTIVTVFVS